MTVRAIITMLLCVVPVWGGLILSIVKLQRMDPPPDEDDIPPTSCME